MKNVLGISAYYHDSAAALVVGDQIIAAAQEERFSRVKHTSEFPESAIRYCLREGGIDIDALDAVVFYDKPLLKFERLLETYYANAPWGIRSFLSAMPAWIGGKLFLRDQIKRGLKRVGKYNKRKLNLLFSKHHLSHAASAFYPSPYDQAAILTIDGVGEWETATISVGSGESIEQLKAMNFPHSLGLLYSSFTQFLGFRVNNGEYKMMGLSSYGDPDSERTRMYLEKIRADMVDIKEDGSIWMDQSYFSYSTGLTMINEKKWENLFGLKRRESSDPISSEHCDLALAIQKVTEEVVIAMAREAARVTKLPNLCMAGGVALNCMANGKLLKEGIFKDIFIQPASGDAGGALGAALAINHIHFGAKRVGETGKKKFNPCLGPSFDQEDVLALVDRVTETVTQLDDPDSMADQVAAYLAEGAVVGWFQSRMEFGPRALGNRSILGDPRRMELHKRINGLIKFREDFRPFAPAILKEEVDNYFELDTDSPYMLLAVPVKSSRQKPLPKDYHDFSMGEKMEYVRSTIPAVTHVDMSARVQSVDVVDNPGFYRLIRKFFEKTKCPVLINTSFNTRDEPIVCTPEDAYRCFKETDIDYLVIGNFLFSKDQHKNTGKGEKL